MGIGFVQEGKRLFRTRTVEENLIIGAHSLRLRHRELSEAIDEAFDMFPQLVSRRAHLAGALSGGQQQMLAISQALMSKPNLLLIDEPTLGLAPVVSREVLYALRQLPRAGVAVLLVEQSIEQALEVADDVVVIELGQVIFRGRTSDPGTAKAVEQSCSVFRSKR
jgi:branched-chain amino acid transport system ATP-binding protein